MIFYLSCTGNTLWAAKYLADATNDRLISITEAVKGDCKYSLKEGERLGFCLPVHGWKLQQLVVDFLTRLTLNANNEGRKQKYYTYVLLTSGDSTGEVLDQLERELNGRGLEVNSSCGLIMPESYIGLPFMDVDTDMREAEKKIEAAKLLRKFGDVVVERRSLRMPLVRGYAPRIYSRVIGPFFHKFLITDKKFRVDADKCIGCGKCAKVCPVDNIQMSGEDLSTTGGVGQTLPSWLHTGRCLTCFACYHYCPQKAISYWAFTKGKGQYYYERNRRKCK